MMQIGAKTGQLERWGRTTDENCSGDRWKMRARLEVVREPYPFYTDPLHSHPLIR
ncbi:MAG: hypothetical protein JNJ70_14350 [Verrucomicrobiales bacterium]|nr:hypothetical protein [Verrucomicrobiales bacterium]